MAAAAVCSHQMMQQQLHQLVRRMMMMVLEKAVVLRACTCLKAKITPRSLQPPTARHSSNLLMVITYVIFSRSFSDLLLATTHRSTRRKPLKSAGIGLLCARFFLLSQPTASEHRHKCYSVACQLSC